MVGIPESQSPQYDPLAKDRIPESPSLTYVFFLLALLLWLATQPKLLNYTVMSHTSFNSTAESKNKRGENKKERQMDHHKKWKACLHWLRPITIQTTRSISISTTNNNTENTYQNIYVVDVAMWLPIANTIVTTMSCYNVHQQPRFQLNLTHIIS